MKNNIEDCPERVFADYDNQKTIETLYKIFSGLKNKRYSAGFPFLAELIRRLLDRWALGDDPDPWLPFSGWFSIYDSPPRINIKPIGTLRYLWASSGELFKRPCKCGAYRYAVDFNRWFSSAWGYYSCIGCNSFDTVQIGSPSEMDRELSKSAFHIYSNKRTEDYQPEPAEVLKLLKILGMGKNLSDLLKNHPLAQR